jgi:hypothetical protein
MRRWLVLGGTGGLLVSLLCGAAPEARPQAASAQPAEPAGAAQEATGPAQPPTAAGAPSPRNASYSITARLDPDSHTLTGREILTWRNISGRATSELRFHLYYNAWRNSESTWMRERQLAGSRDLAARPEADWGWIDVTRVQLLGSGEPEDLTDLMQFIAPDDGNEADRTVLRIPLAEAVEPDAVINVELEWTSHIPRTFARTGVQGDYFFIAQWFPKIGVLEDAGWNCHQFHAGTEFFADYGTYDVQLTVPAGWVVGATGLERERRDNANETTTHRYYQEDVHDFAWTTSPDFIERSGTFEHATLPDVTIRLLLQPEHLGQADRHLEATRATLRYYGEWYGPYPYGHITVVDPAWQSGTGGMEYPTLFTAGSRWLAPARVTQPEGVTIHEAGHQFWYGIVGNNEFEHAWMDEGINTFSTARVIEQAFEPNYLVGRYFGGFVPWVFRDLPRSRATDGNRLGGYRAAAESDAQDTPSYRYFPSTGGAITYNKTALWLHTLERYLGWPILQRGLATLFDMGTFRHPTPDDVFAALNGASRRDLGWFFDQVYRGSNTFDYGIDSLTSVPASARGYFLTDDDARFEPETDSQGRYRTTVVVRRHGEATFPVDVLTTFEDGSELREQWDGAARWKQFTYEGMARAVSAQVDPDRVLLLDVNYTNNGRTLRPRGAEAAAKWSLSWMLWLQDLLLTHAFFV